jgi:hypothetical protein
MLKRLADLTAGVLLVATAALVTLAGPLTANPAARLLPVDSLAPFALLLASIF